MPAGGPTSVIARIPVGTRPTGLPVSHAGTVGRSAPAVTAGFTAVAAADSTAVVALAGGRRTARCAIGRKVATGSLGVTLPAMGSGLS